MKTIYTFLTTALIVVTAHFASAQTETVTYQSKGGIKQVPAAEAFYFTVEKVGSDKLITSVRYLTADSTKVRQMTFRRKKVQDMTNNILQGPQYEWHSNGKLYSEATYQNGNPVGVHTYWHETGDKDYIKKYNSKFELDTLEAYHKNGAVRRLEVYSAGKMVLGHVYDETGKELEYFPMLKMPSFPGGEQAMQSWLARNLTYPKTTRKDKAQGLVVVSFVVNEAGKITDAEAIKGVHPDADAEALRVINSMPLWEIGLLEGKPSKVRFTVPIRFSL